MDFDTASTSSLISDSLLDRDHGAANARQLHVMNMSCLCH